MSPKGSIKGHITWIQLKKESQFQNNSPISYLHIKEKVLDCTPLYHSCKVLTPMTQAPRRRCKKQLQKQKITGGSMDGWIEK